jgi:hypothetical protein
MFREVTGDDWLATALATIVLTLGLVLYRAHDVIALLHRIFEVTGTLLWW